LVLLLSILLSPATSETTKTWDYAINLAPSTPETTPLRLESSLAFPFASLYVEFTAFDFNSSDPTIDYSAILSFPTLVPSLELDYSGPAENDSAVFMRYRFEPCGTPDLLDLDHQIVAEILQRSAGSSNLTGSGSVTLQLEETFVKELPWEGRIGEGKGMDEFKTVMMKEEMGSLFITLWSESRNLNEVIPEIIVATGSQCIYKFEVDSKDRVVYTVPDGTIFTITVPASDIWFIAFKNNRIDEEEDSPVIAIENDRIGELEFSAFSLRIEYLEAEQLPETDPNWTFEASSGYMNGIYLNLIVGLILVISNLYRS